MTLEPILNEHPVTIYPGPKDGAAGPGARNNRPKRLQASVEKHKEVCHILNPGNTSVSSSSSSSSPASTGTSSDNQNHKTHSSSSNNTLDKNYTKTTDDEDEDEEDDMTEDSGEDPSGITVSSESTLLTPRGIAWEIHFKDFKKKTKQHQKEVKKVFKEKFNDLKKIVRYINSFQLFFRNLQLILNIIM